MPFLKEAFNRIFTLAHNLDRDLQSKWPCDRPLHHQHKRSVLCVWLRPHAHVKRLPLVLAELGKLVVARFIHNDLNFTTWSWVTGGGKKLRTLVLEDDVDLWSLDECHFQRYGTRCRMWAPPEDRDPMALRRRPRCVSGRLLFGMSALDDRGLLQKSEKW